MATTTTEIQTVRSGADKAKMGLSALLVLVGFAAYFLLNKKGATYQWGAVLFSLALALGLTLSSHWGKTFMLFCRESWRELKKVVWPKPRETWQMTGIVFAFVVVMALFLAAVDYGLGKIIFEWILNWKK